MARPSQPRRSARIAGRKPTAKDSPEPSSPAQRQRPHAARRNSKANQDDGLRLGRSTSKDRLKDRESPLDDQELSDQLRSPSPRMPPPPTPQIPKHLQTPESAHPRRQVSLGISPLYPHRPSKRRVNDSAELPPAKRIRPNVQTPGLTPLAFHNQTVVSPDGEVLLSPITARKHSIRPSILTNTSPGPGPSPERKSPEAFRCQAATFHLQPPAPKEQSATVANQFRLPANRPIVPQTAKMMRIESWLKELRTDDRQDHPPPQSLPMSPLSLSTNRSFGAGAVQPKREEPVSQPIKEQSAPEIVPVTKPTVVDLVSLSSSYEYSYCSYSARSASKKNDSEYESAQELLQTHGRAKAEASPDSPSPTSQPEGTVKKAQRAFEMIKTLIYKSKDDNHKTESTGAAVHSTDVDGPNGT